ISKGNSTTTTSSSWFRRRKKTSRSSLRKNLRFPRTYATGSRPPVAPPAGTSAWLMVDIEALPGKADEELFQARGLDGQAAYPDAGVHELGADELRLRVAQLGSDLV